MPQVLTSKMEQIKLHINNSSSDQVLYQKHLLYPTEIRIKTPITIKNPAQYCIKIQKIVIFEVNSTKT